MSRRNRIDVLERKAAPSPVEFEAAQREYELSGRLPADAALAELVWLFGRTFEEVEQRAVGLEP